MHICHQSILLAQLYWAEDASECTTFSCVNKCRPFAWAHEFGKLIGASSRGTRASMVRPKIDDRSKVDVGGDRDPRQEPTRLSDRQSEIIQLDKDGTLTYQFNSVQSQSHFRHSLLLFCIWPLSVSLTGHWCDCLRANITTIFDKVGQRCQCLKTLNSVHLSLFVLMVFCHWRQWCQLIMVSTTIKFDGKWSNDHWWVVCNI